MGRFAVAEREYPSIRNKMHHTNKIIRKAKTVIGQTIGFSIHAGASQELPLVVQRPNPVIAGAVFFKVDVGHLRNVQNLVLLIGYQQDIGQIKSARFKHKPVRLAVTSASKGFSTTTSQSDFGTITTVFGRLCCQPAGNERKAKQHP